MGPTLADGYAIVDRFPAPDWLTDDCCSILPSVRKALTKGLPPLANAD